ncbi:UNKNOWN [Stylonychia lemnae]|uniref:Uncharacterized protein n=1 Tax=Stylonychia lemnae TaxID=5949 RepID=A0A078AJY3_STYLE|nr:UNKNOWN [Stylonychia lemnae]|eukprot:CDW82201.1 UNKNOWN [Stylonychia lemnae]
MGRQILSVFIAVKIANLVIEILGVKFVLEKSNQRDGFLLVCETQFSCEKCSQDDTTQCTQCTFPINQKSELTGDYLHPCISQKGICLETKNEDNCEICIQGYSLYKNIDGNQLCQKCENDYKTSVDNEVISTPIRCNFTFDTQKSQLVHRGLIESSICSICSDNCFECASQAECISCKKGFYLYTGSSQKTTGQCVQKSGNSDIILYVDSAPDKLTLDQTTGLSLQDPFYSLQSAIVKAYEYGAKYLQAIIHIILIPGKVHSMMRYADDLIIPQAFDQYSQSTVIKIDSLDGTQVKILYKLRDKFNFLIGGGLEIRNVVFDATDSILDSRQTYLDQNLINLKEYSCLQDPFNNCCQILKDQSSRNFSIIGPEFCLLIRQPYLNSSLSNTIQGYHVLNISGGVVQDFGRMTNFSQNSFWVNPLLKMQKMGLYLDLDNFQGPIIIEQVSFIDNLIVDLDYEQSWKILNNVKLEIDQYQNYGPKAKVQQGLYASQQSIQNQQEYCLGYQVKNNLFQQNFGFSGISGGSFYFECCNYQQIEEPNGIIKLPQFQSAREDSLNSLNLSDLEEESYSLEMNGNIYIDNTASNQNGIISIINVKKFKIKNDTFINNTDAFLQKTTVLAKQMLPGYQPTDKNIEIELMVVDSEKSLAISLIKIERSRYVDLSSIIFEQNYLIELESSLNRSQCIFLRDVEALKTGALRMQSSDKNLHQAQAAFQESPFSLFNKLHV